MSDGTRFFFALRKSTEYHRFDDLSMFLALPTIDRPYEQDLIDYPGYAAQKVQSAMQVSSTSIAIQIATSFSGSLNSPRSSGF